MICLEFYLYIRSKIAKEMETIDLEISIGRDENCQQNGKRTEGNNEIKKRESKKKCTNE